MGGLILNWKWSATPGDADPANRGAGSPTATMEVQKWGMRWALILWPFNNGGKWLWPIWDLEDLEVPILRRNHIESSEIKMRVKPRSIWDGVCSLKLLWTSLTLRPLGFFPTPCVETETSLSWSEMPCFLTKKTTREQPQPQKNKSVFLFFNSQSQRPILCSKGSFEVFFAFKT